MQCARTRAPHRRSNLPLAHEGDALFNVAAFKSVARAETKVEQFAAIHADLED
jgi:hypothetical protein